jgi:hypothetical protein
MSRTAQLPKHRVQLFAWLAIAAVSYFLLIHVALYNLGLSVPGHEGFTRTATEQQLDS